MSKPRFLADQGFNEHIVRGVERRQPAVEFLRVREMGRQEASDPDLLEYTAAQGWILLSHDVNTMTAAASARLASGSHFPGLFLIHQGTPVAQIIEELLLIWELTELEEWADQIRFLPL